MTTRWKVVALCAVLALAVPLVPRLVAATVSPENAEHFARWGTALRVQLANRPLKLLGEWVWVMSPHLMLGVVAGIVLKTNVGIVGPRVQARRVIGFLAAAIGATLIGFFWCRPVAGMAFRFYIGEGVYPIMAVPAMAILYPLGWWVGRFVSRPSPEREPVPPERG